MATVYLLLALHLAVLTQGKWGGKIEERYYVDQENMFSEGMTYDKVNNRLIFSTLMGAHIYHAPPPTKNGDRFTPTASGVFVNDDGATLGCHVDNDRNLLYVAYSNFAGTYPAGVLSFDLNEFTPVNSSFIEGAVLMNDLCMGEDNFLYSTESKIGSVFSHTPDLSLSRSVIIGSPYLKPKSAATYGADGIVCIDNYVVVGNLDTGMLVKLPVSEGFLNGPETPVSISDPKGLLVGADGIVKLSNQSVAVITRNHTVIVTSTDDWKTGMIETSINTEKYGWCTAGGVTKDDKELYVIASDIGKLGKETVPAFNLTRMRLDHDSDAGYMAIGLLLLTLIGLL